MKRRLTSLEEDDTYLDINFSKGNFKFHSTQLYYNHLNGITLGQKLPSWLFCQSWKGIKLIPYVWCWRLQNPLSPPALSKTVGLQLDERKNLTCIYIYWRYSISVRIKVITILSREQSEKSTKFFVFPRSSEWIFFGIYDRKKERVRGKMFTVTLSGYELCTEIPCRLIPASWKRRWAKMRKKPSDEGREVERISETHGETTEYKIAYSYVGKTDRFIYIYTYIREEGGMVHLHL